VGVLVILVLHHVTHVTLHGCGDLGRSARAFWSDVPAWTATLLLIHQALVPLVCGPWGRRGFRFWAVRGGYIWFGLVWFVAALFKISSVGEPKLSFMS
jgi:hypothetical protein